MKVYRIVTELRQYRSLKDEASERSGIGAEEILIQIKSIEQFIDGIPDSELRRIFRYRYTEGKRMNSWRYIARRLGHAGDGSTERKKHNKYLEENAFYFCQ